MGVVPLEDADAFTKVSQPDTGRESGHAGTNDHDIIVGGRVHGFSRSRRSKGVSASRCNLLQAIPVERPQAEKRPGKIPACVDPRRSQSALGSEGVEFWREIFAATVKGGQLQVIGFRHLDAVALAQLHHDIEKIH